MTIRTRAFTALWLLNTLAAVAIALALYSYRDASRLELDQQRLSEVLHVHSTMWRALADMKADHRGYQVTGSPRLLARLVDDRRLYLSSIERLVALTEDADQRARLAEVRAKVSAWPAMTDADPAAPATVAEAEIIVRTADAAFAPIQTPMEALETREREFYDRAGERTRAQRRNVAIGIVSAAGIGIVVISLLLVSTKRGLFDPLTRLTESAQRIGEGDFGAAHQTLRDDEIGVLINSFAQMAQAVQTRERELAKALSDSRDLAAVTAESRRRVEAAHADLLATLETVPAALMIFNADGSVRLRNRAATDVFGIEPQNPELRRNYWTRFKRVAIDGKEIPADQWISARTLRGERADNEELEIHHPDGRVFPIIASGAPMLNDLGHVVGAVVAFQDISRLREADRMKDEFVSIVSHELRTPLTSIRGSVQLVLDDQTSVPDAEHRQLLQIAQNNCERLVRIINDILDVAKIESGSVTLDRKPTQVAEIVRQAVQVVEGPARTARVALKVTLPASLPPVMVDQDRLVQALVNLLSNAVKFAPPESSVSVTAAAAASGTITVSVADQGEGIAPENVKRLFRKFQQVDSSSSRRKGGTGLGLAITKALIEQHGGRIGVDSVLTKGTTFWFTLPAASAEEAALVAPVAANKDGSASLRMRRVLIVDDDDDFRDVLRQHLSRAGYVVLDARDGASALHVARTSRPDVITVDLLMPGLDGWSFITRLRQEETLAKIPVIVMSGLDDAGAPGRLPADIAVLTKGERPDRLLAEIGQALAGQGHATVLVAEDDADLRGILAAGLARDGHRVLQARDGAEALATIDRQRVDLLVLDLWMPNVDGFEVLERLRGTDGETAMPVVVVTGGDRSSTELRALRLGADVYLTKPIEAAALTEQVTRLLRRE